MKQAKLLLFFLCLAVFSELHSEDSLTPQKIISLCRYDEARVWQVHGRGTKFQEVDEYWHGRPPISNELKARVDRAIDGFTRDQRFQIAMGLLEPQLRRFACLSVLEDIILSQVSDRKLTAKQKSQVSSAIRKYMDFHRKNWQGYPGNYLRFLNDVIHANIAFGDPFLKKPKMVECSIRPHSVSRFETLFSDPEDHFVYPPSWEVNGGVIFSDDEGGILVNLETGESEPLGLSSRYSNLLVLKDFLILDNRFRARTEGALWQPLEKWPGDLYGGKVGQGDEAFQLWSVPPHYMKPPEDRGSKPLTKNPISLKTKLFRFDADSQKVIELVDHNKFPFLSLEIGEDTALYQLGSGRLVATSAERHHPHSVERVFVADTVENKSFTERFSLKDTFLMSAGESDTLWIFRSRPDGRGEMQESLQPLPDMMFMFHADTGVMELGFERQRDYPEPPGQILMGPPMVPKWDVGKDLLEPPVDEITKWQPFEKNGDLWIFIRKMRVGYDDRPQFFLHRFGDKTQTYPPLAISFEMDESADQAEARFEFDPSVYVSRKDLVIAGPHEIWKLSWDEITKQMESSDSNRIR